MQLILFKNIEELPTSEELLDMSVTNNLKNLYQIIQYPLSELMRKPKVNYRILAELGAILKGYDLLDLVNED